MSTGDEGDAPSDLVAQMYWPVVEESRLFELPLGALESDGRGGRATFGPWDPAECSRQLLAWSDAGLVELFATPDDAPRPRNAEEWQAWNAGESLRWLAPIIARQLLAEPERWTLESDDGLVCVIRTDAGVDRKAPWC